MSSDPAHAAAGGDTDELALYRTVFDEIPDVALVKDQNGNFLLCNRTVARLYNTTPEAMIGKHDGDFGVPEEMAEFFRANVLAIMARGETEVVFEDTRDAVTGEIRHFKSIKRPFKDNEGCDRILVIGHDITDVVRAQSRIAESERRLQEVMAATREGVWDWHLASGRVIHNDQWYSILGFSEGEIADNVEAFSARIHPDDKAAVWERLQSLLAGTAQDYYSEHRMLCKDGSVIWVQDRGRIAERDAGGQAVRVVGAYIDISGRRRDQAALERALDAAQSATRAKSDFLATMSHEIRTPMNGILGMAQLLLMADVGEEERREYARTILNSGQTLLTLLNDILDLSKVEAGRMDLVRAAFDPEQLLSETIAIFREPIQEKDLEIKAEWRGSRQPRYWGDPVRLRQMLANFVSNAIKFTDRGWIRVDAREIGREGESAILEFAVADSGIGIPADKQGLLFQPFSQADASTTRKYGGTGLGLSIVRSLAALMGGEVGVESRAGEGARFWFRIRAEAMGANEDSRTVSRSVEVSPDARTPALSGRLLVAEDVAVNRKVIGALLGKLGLQAEFVADGRAAVEAVTGGMQPDLILMDVQMPVMDGLEATERIRAWEKENGRPHCAIVALTAGAFEEDRQRCSDAGMDDFLSKPIGLQNLTQTLGRWLGG